MAIPTTAITAKEQQYLDVVKIIKAKNKRITDMEHGGLTDDENLLSGHEVEQSSLKSCESRGEPRYNPKLFCAHDVDIRAGDYIVLRRYSDDGKLIHTYKGLAAQPSWYSTHQEIFIRVDEEA